MELREKKDERREWGLEREESKNGELNKNG